MKTALRYVLVLGIICLVMGSGVAMVYAVFQERVAANERAQFSGVLRKVMPADLPAEAVKLLAGSPENGDDVYAAYGPDGRPVAFAARGVWQGYSSKVKILVGTAADARLTIRRVEALDQQETPGLGANISQTQSTWTLWQKAHLAPAGKPEQYYNHFMDAFGGLTVGGGPGSGGGQVSGGGPAEDELNKVTPMTAATITSDAVKNGVRQAVARIRQAATISPTSPAGGK